MSTLLEKLKQDHIGARKQRDAVAANLLGTIIAVSDTAAHSGKQVRTLQDSDIIAVIQHVKNGVAESLALLAGQSSHNEAQTKLMAEAAILDKDLPTQLTDAQISEIAVQQHTLGLNLGQIMQHLRQNYLGQYDSKRAVELVRAVE